MDDKHLKDIKEKIKSLLRKICTDDTSFSSLIADTLDLDYNVQITLLDAFEIHHDLSILKDDIKKRLAQKLTTPTEGTDEYSVIIQKEKGSVKYKVNSTAKSILNDFQNAAYLFSKQDDTESRYKDNDTLKAGTYHIAYLSPTTKGINFGSITYKEASIYAMDLSTNVVESENKDIFFQNREKEVKNLSNMGL